MDRLTPQERSSNMASIPSRNTNPEMIVRKTVHSLGYRYRLHQKSLPGTPDLTFLRKRKVIFVHGCFWHRHKGCAKASTPTTRADFWQEKFDSNVARDRRVTKALKREGWKILVVWQCELKNSEALARRIDAFLKD